MEDNLLDVDEVSNILKITKQGVYQLVHKRQIPFLKISRRMIRFRESDINKWLESKLTLPNKGEKDRVGSSNSKVLRFSGRTHRQKLSETCRNAPEIGTDNVGGKH